METIEFGQKQPIHIAIRSLIHDYPQDEGILKELIQNADDGGATSIRFILDRHIVSSTTGPVPGWDLFSSPSLVVTNSAPFAPDDIKNIQRLSNSGKVRQINQTGRYGRGFNAVYNLTDTPLLVTGEYVSLFDPCGFHVGDSKSGTGWKLSSSEWAQTYPDALRVFESGGLESGSSYHDGTIFRFPLRQKLRGATSDDRITDQLFLPETFRRLVDGLEKLADQVVLFLRNITFIGCYEIPPNGGAPIPLLEIKTINQEEVKRGRQMLASVLDQAKDIDGVLDVIENLEEGHHETIFKHHISIRRPGKEDSLTWLVCSGVYAGKDDGLVDLARNLNHSGNKAIPLAGAAVCLERNGKVLPGMEGKVSCFLPLSGVLGGAKLGFSINGSFDLDGSRTGITKHKEGEFGITEDRATWNARLIDEAVLHAVTSVFSHVTVRTAEDVSRFYRLFPDPKVTLPEPFSNFVSGFYGAISTKPVFSVSDSSRVAIKDLRLIPDDLSLQAALEMELLPIPSPRLPWNLQEGFRNADVDLVTLESDTVAAAYRREESVTWSPDEIDIESLKEPRRLEAVTRFLVENEWSDWEMLPLALCDDGELRTFPDGENDEEDTLFVATKRQKEIFDWFPEWFLDSDYCTTTGLQNTSGSGYSHMSIQDVLENLEKVIIHDETGESCWDPKGDRSPNSKWLASVIIEILDVKANGGPEDLTKQIERVTLIPGDDGCLHKPGTATTPLLVNQTETALTSILSALGVRYFVQDPRDPLTPLLTRFRNEIGRLWSLTPGDLIDSLGIQLDKLCADPDTWRTQHAADRLMSFLSSASLELTDERKTILGTFPIWLDIHGEYGSINENTYFAGEFHAPACSAGFRILSGDGQHSLAEKLGVKTITRSALLSGYLLPVLANLSDEMLVQVTQWIRDEWNHLSGEHEDGEDGLLEVLKDHRLIIDDCGQRKCAPDLYLQDAAEIAVGVLGDNVRTPSLEFYKTEPALWRRFFETLGMLTSPSAQHLTNFIETMVAACADRLPTPTEEKALIQLLKHVRDQFTSFADEEVESEELGDVEFAEFLAETAWVPAFRPTDGVTRYGAWHEPESRLFKPSELLHYSLGARAASTRALSPSGIVEFSADARERLGIVRLPSAQELCSHLKNVVTRVGAETLSEEAYRSIEKPLEEIYRGLGELDREAQKDTTGVAVLTLQKVCSSLGDLACVLHPKLRRLMLARDVYEGDASGMTPLKVVLKGGSVEVDRGLALLGRLERPGISDLAATLCDLAGSDRNLSGEELAASIACVRRLFDLLRSEEAETIPAIALPNAEGKLMDPEDLIWDNDPVLSRQLDLPSEWLLHPDVPGLAGERLNVPSLSAARAKPDGEIEISGNEVFLAECKRIETLIRSQEFSEGLERLLLQDQRAFYPSEVAWLDLVSVTACRKVSCAYTITLPSGRVLPLGSAMTEVAFVDFGSECEFFVAEDARDAGLIEDHFGRELLKQLGDQAPEKDGAIIRLLRGTAADVATILDRLHVPQKSSNPEQREDDQDTVIFGGEDEDTGEDESTGEDEGDDEDADGDEDTDGDEDADDDEDADECEDADDDGEPVGVNTNTGQRRGGTTQGNRHSGGSGNSGGGWQRPSGGGRTGSPGGTGATRGRMLKGGEEDSKKEGRRLQANGRQQDGLWISRPKTERQAAETRQEGDSHNDEDDSGRNIDIGDAAVGWVLQFEHSQGRKAMSMAHANPGYDVESKRGRIVERYIEVKGIDGEWGQNGVPLSAIQWFRSLQPEDPENPESPPISDKFWLYVVEHARDPQKVKIHMIQNPTAKASQFRVDHGWKHAGVTAMNFRPILPRKGMKLRREASEGGYEEGVIQLVQESGSITWLEVKFDSQSAKRITYNPTRHLLIQ
jgi:sacsin